MSRRSLTYEVRLFKYSKRGFALAVPGFDRSRVDPRIFQKRDKEVKGLAKLLVFEFNQPKKPVASTPKRRTLPNAASPTDASASGETNNTKLDKSITRSTGDEFTEDKVKEYEAQKSEADVSIRTPSFY